jgi:hypothetical protein
VSPSGLAFNVVQGGAVPDGKLLQIGDQIAGTGVYLTIGPPPPDWLYIPVSWTGAIRAPISLLVGVNSNATKLAPGTYNTSLRFFTTDPDRSVSVPITLVVDAPPPMLKTSVSQLQFSYIMGAPIPPAQTIQVTSSGSPLSVNVTPSASWLSASTLNGTTPLAIDVKVNPPGLTPATYHGFITVRTGLGSVFSQQVVLVDLTVTADDRQLPRPSTPHPSVRL